jgi:hypothetical protein
MAATTYNKLFTLSYWLTLRTYYLPLSLLQRGQPPHPRVYSDFKYQEKIFFNSPIDVLWTSFKRSRLLERKDELGIAESRRYPVLEEIKIKCILCGKVFSFTASEQKWYKKREFSPPKRCQDCIEQEYIKRSRNW